MLPPVIARRTAARAAKRVVEAADGTETGIQRDLHNFTVGRGEQSLGVGNPVLRQVVNQRRPKRFLKQTHRIVGMQADGFSYGVNGQPLRVSLRNETRHLLNLV